VRKFAHLVQYALLRAAIAVLTRIPDRFADRMGAAAGRLGYSPLGIRRKVVDDNLRQAFPEKDQAWRDDVARQSYEHLGRETLSMLRLSVLDSEVTLRDTAVDGVEEAHDIYLRKGKGAVVVVGHFGNWEIGAATMARRGYPLDVIVQRQANPWFDRYLTAARERMGARVIERSRAPREGLRSLRQGRVLVFAADQNARRGGVFVPFFGRLASTHRGAALMAIRTGAPMILALPMRQPNGKYLLRAEVVEAYPEQLNEDMEKAIEILTARFTARLEAAIREEPGQYLWHHRRWKTRPPA
jgi:KDO2-lipid IV(A) lauroyltransferase